MVYPVGPRRLKRRWLFSLTALAGASFVLMSALERSPRFDQDVAADAVATADVAEPGQAALPLGQPAHPVIAKASALPLMSAAMGLLEAQTKAPFLELGALDSTEGETLDDFLVRVAQAMDVFTRQTNHEVCGVILVNEAQDAWRVRLTTNRSHISCVMVSFDEPGYKRLGPDIHSHPRVPGGIPANSQDVARNPKFHCGQNMVVFDETFSEKDLERGPGYLVSRNRLMFQRGKMFPFQQRAVFPSLEQMPSLTLLNGEVASFDSGLVASDAEEQPVSTLVAAWKNEDAEGLPSTTCPPPPGDPEVMEESLVAKHLGESHEEPVAKATRPRLK